MNISQQVRNKRQIDWRREKVLELASDGHGVVEISGILKVSHPTISRDMHYLRRQAKKDIHKYITDQVPFEYKKTLAGLEGIIKYMASIMSDDAKETKERMQAASIKIQAYNMKMEMVSGANLIEEGIDLVERYRGLIPQKGNPLKDNAEQPT